MDTLYFNGNTVICIKKITYSLLDIDSNLARNVLFKKK